MRIEMGNGGSGIQALRAFNLFQASANDQSPAGDRQPTRKERSLERKRQKDKQRLNRDRRKKFSKILWIAVVVLVIGGGIVGGALALANRPTTPESEIISRQGIHWRSEISINILGQEQDIPANIGITGVEKPIHTHDEDSVISLEFGGLVTKEDLLLGGFFMIWGEKFDRNCIMTQCNGPEGEVKMFVNGEPNFEFENYSMRDNDKIEIIFE